MSELTAPVAKKEPTTRVHHGREFVDNYEWLRDKENPEVISYLEEENAYTKQETAHLETLTENIYQEIKSRVKETDLSVPVRRGDYWYFSRTQEGKDYGLSCRVRADNPALETQAEAFAENPTAVAEAHSSSIDADPSQRLREWLPPHIPEDEELPGEEILLDSNELAKGHEFFSLGALSVSPGAGRLAYSVDTSGDERFTLKIKDLDTGDLLEDELTGLFYGALWANDEVLFYLTVDESWRPNRIWRHKVGTPQSEDVLVFQEDDPRFSVGVGQSHSRDYLFIEAGSKTTNEIYALATEDAEGDFKLLWPRDTGVEYQVEHALVAGENRWLVLHNTEGENYALGECAAVYGEDLPSLKELNSLVPHRSDVRLEGAEPCRDHIVLSYRANALSTAAVMKLNEQGYTTFEELPSDEELYTLGLSGLAEWDAPTLWLGYGSYVTPYRLYSYEVATGEKTLLKEQPILGEYNPTDYVAKRHWTKLADGTRIPVSIIHRKDLDLSTPQPTILSGYGSYEISSDPSLSIGRLSMMDRGMIVVFAHVRGGGEMGRAWYDHGKMLEKRNTFTDFIAVGRDLVEMGLSSPDTLVANGGSAGGLLMGAVANMAPDLFHAIEADVPFVDPLTSMLMPELPLTTGEWEEWGNPFDDVEVYDYMASYSPYENVSAQNYPNILAVTSLNDTRVLYVEPAKWIAKLRDTATGGNFLLKTEMAAGHGGVSGRYARWRQSAEEMAWLINQATGLES